MAPEETQHGPPKTEGPGKEPPQKNLEQEFPPAGVDISQIYEREPRRFVHLLADYHRIAAATIPNERCEGYS